MNLRDAEKEILNTNTNNANDNNINTNVSNSISWSTYGNIWYLQSCASANMER